MRENHIDDKDYIECLSPLYRMSYYRWRKLMLPKVDRIVEFARVHGFEAAKIAFELTPRDVHLLTVLRYLTEEEIDEFNLRGAAFA